MVRIKNDNVNTEKFWDDKHGAGQPHNAAITPQFERFFAWGYIPTNESVSILDVGCGQALHFRDLKSKYPLVSWNGLDISEIVRQKNHGHASDATFYKKDIMTEEIVGVYDYIISMHTFEHFEDPLFALQKCIKHCRKDVIICVPYEDAWGTDSSHVHKFTLTDPFTNYKAHRISDNNQEIFFVFSGEANV